MRILVCSDSHGRVGRLLRAAERQPGAARVVFLGDGENDSDALARPGLLLTRVRGNCDFGSQLPLWERFSAGGRQVLCTHGHSSRVKYGLDELLQAALSHGADLVLYGHTHTPRLSYEQGVYLFNPGSIYHGSYGFVDITAAGIVCVHCAVS